MKNIGKLIHLFFILFLFFHMISAQSADKKSTEKRPLEQKKQLQKQIRTITQSLKVKENKKNRLQKSIHHSDRKIQKLGTKLLAITEKRAASQKKIAGLEQEKSVVTEKIAASTQILAQMIRAFYMLPTQTPVSLFISQNNFGKSGRQKIYYDYFVKAYLKRHQAYTTQLVNLESLNETLANRITSLVNLADENKRHTASLKLEYEQRKIQLKGLAKEIGKGSSKIRLLKADQKRLEKLAKAIAKLKAKKSTGMSFAKHKGTLIWPVKGRVVSKFGRSRTGSKLKWRGVLIETNAGAEVKAVANGRVVFSDWLTGYGFVLIIEHGRGYMSLYGHNQQLLKSVGDKIHKNERIALAGNSGRSGNPALYFEIRHKGKPVNPTKWIIANKSRH